MTDDPRLAVPDAYADDATGTDDDDDGGCLPSLPAAGQLGTVGIDATYHHPLEGEVRKMLVAHWGAAQEEPREPPSQKSCIRFAPRAGLGARACLLQTQWQITITRSE